MVIETAKNQIVLNQIIGKKKETRQVETDVIVNDIKPDVFKVIGTNGIVNIYKKEIMDGKVKIEGSINTYIIYMADDEQSSIRSLNTSLDFTQVVEIENCKENMSAQVNVSVKSFETKVLNGRKLNTKANIEIIVSVYANEKFEVITGINNVDDVQLLNNTQQVTTLIGNGSNKVGIKDTIAIDITDELAEIMKVNFKIIDEEIKISYNKVLSKADAAVEIMYLTEDGRINTISTKIPIMGFVDIQDVTDSCNCEVQNSLSNLIIKPNMSEEHSIYVEAEIEVLCSAYETKEINIIEDLYSITRSVEFLEKNVNVVTEKNKINDICIIKENIRIPEITGRVLDVQINPTLNSEKVRNGKIVYDGNLNIDILFEQNNGINMRNIDLQFNFEINSDKVSEKSIAETILKVRQNDFIIRDGIIEVTVGIEFNVEEQKNKRINMIEDIQMEEIKSCDNYSMVIYFVKPGDSLWKIAKMFKSTVEDITKINDLEDENKINVGEQLYIPRYCKNKVAMRKNG